MKNSDQIKYFLYARKSSESEDRQVQSIDDQIHLMTQMADQQGLQIVDVLFEAKSAKKPNQREKFNEMVRRIEQGEANGVLCWQLNRLARNQLENGMLGQMLDDGIIASIMTNNKEYRPEDNVIVFGVETAQSTQFSKELAVNVRRGQESRVRNGYYPSRAPMGYINDKNLGEIVEDPERFDVVRKMWDLALTGRYSQRQIYKIVNEEWGFVTIKRGKTGGGAVSMSQIYKMFGNIFYTGTHFVWNGTLHNNGQHPPMVTMEEFERVQEIFRKSNRPRPSKDRAPYLGLIKCGCGCGCMYTGEVSVRFIKEAQENRTYIHYRSTKRRKDVNCIGERISLADLDKQIIGNLEKGEIIQPFLDWAFETIDENAARDQATTAKANKLKDQSVENKEKELRNLRYMRMKDFIDDTEFVEERDRIEKEIETLKQREAKNADIELKRDSLKDNLNFLAETKGKIINGSNKVKTSILSYFGDEHKMSGKELVMSVHDWMKPILTNYKNLEHEYDRLGMKDCGSKQSQNDDLETIRLAWCPREESNLE